MILSCVLSVSCPDYYTPAMLGLKMDQEVLGELVRTKAPVVWQAMGQHNVMWTLVVSRWFICLYIDVLPVEVRGMGGMGGGLKSKERTLAKSSLLLEYYY